MCVDDWTSKWSNLVCGQLGGSTSKSTEFIGVDELVPRPRVRLTPKSSADANTPLQFVLQEECSSDELIHLTCEQHCELWLFIKF